MVIFLKFFLNFSFEVFKIKKRNIILHVYGLKKPYFSSKHFFLFKKNIQINYRIYGKEMHD